MNVLFIRKGSTGSECKDGTKEQMIVRVIFIADE